MKLASLVMCVLTLSVVGFAGDDDAKGDVERKLLSLHETEATFAGVEYRTCRGRTARCPKECGDSGEYAVFTIDKYLKYEKPGKDGDGKAKERRIQISDFYKKPKGDPKLSETIKGLKKGDRVLLSWKHVYVTRTSDGRSWSGPERPITRLEKIDR
jgi:hypothetical protein